MLQTPALKDNFNIYSSNHGSNFLQKDIALTLTKIGIFPNLKGYHAIVRSIVKRLNANENGLLFPKLNNFCEKEDVANIRNALRVASNSGRLCAINDILGISVVDDTGYFSVKQFLSLLEEYFTYR